MKASIKVAEKTAAGQNTEAASSAAVEVNGMGEVKIHENVISALVRKAILNIDGVSRLAGSTLMDNIAEIVGNRRLQDRAITVTLGTENRVSIDLKVNLKFGYKVPVIATAIQKAVIEEVEQTTGMTVTGVNVIVQELETEPEPEVDEEPVEPAR